MTRLSSALIALLAVAACGTTVHVAPVKVEPIHMTVDINLHDAAKVAPDRTNRR